MAVLDLLTLEETLNLRQHRVFRAVLRLLLAEINQRRAFDAALFSDVQARTDALATSFNEIRALMTPPLETIILPAMTANPPAPLTITQITVSIKGELG